jgi:hypothetical protein
MGGVKLLASPLRVRRGFGMSRAVWKTALLNASQPQPHFPRGRGKKNLSVPLRAGSRLTE